MTTIITKNSSTAADIPTTADLVQGELAVNVTDKRIYTEDSSTQIVELGTNPSALTTTTATVTGVLTANGTLASSNAVITGGAINSTPIGNTTASTIVGSTVTASTGFVGGLTGNVTGNITGNVTGNITGDVTGDVAGNVTASSGTSTVNNLVVNGTVDFTDTRLTDVAEPVSASDAATKNYVDVSINNVIDGAPAALDTLNELASALNDDASFHTTVTNSLTGKLPIAGGTMTGALSLGGNKITSLGTPTLSADAATKAYVDAAGAAGLPTTGGTMTGAIAMSTNKITGMGDPTLAQDASTKAYTDSILGSATSAATSAAAASTSASNASTSESNASGSASAASGSASAASSSATAAAASFDAVDDIYLGAKSSAPSLDNDGNALATGALYFNTASNTMFVYSGSSRAAAGSAVNGTSQRSTYIATSGQTTFAVTYDVGFVDVYLNGVKLLNTTDFTATSGASVVLVTGATTGDSVNLVAYGAFNVANTYTQTAADAKFAQVANNLSDLASSATALTNLGLTATTAELNYTDGVTSAIQTQIDAKAPLTSPTLVTPALGTPASGVMTNVTGAAAGLTAGISEALKSASTSVNTSSATAPTTGQILTATGASAATWQSPAAGGTNGWHLLSTITASAASTVDIESTFNSTYDAYVIVASGVVPNGDTMLYCRLKIGGTYLTTGYSFAFMDILANANFYSGESNGSENQISINKTFETGGASGENGNLIINVYKPSSTSLTKFISWDGSYANPSTLVRRVVGGGGHTSTSALTGVRIYPFGGTISGTFRLYGIANS